MKKKNYSEFVFEKLERRLLFNADPAMLSVSEAQVGGSFGSVVDVAARMDKSTKPDAPASEQFRHEVIFIDKGIDDYQQLMADLQAQTNASTSRTIVLLDSDSDGVDQISAYLNQNQDIDAVHIFSHGSDGIITLGNASLSEETIEDYAADISNWKQSLSDEADLLFYGCNLASGRAGLALVDTISSLTEADVAASDDLTGNILAGGDWQLEYTKGGIETSIAVAPGIHLQWSGLLDTFTVNTTDDTADANPGDGLAQDASGNTSLRAAIMEANALGGDHEINLGPGTYILTLGSDGEDNAEEGDLDIRTEITINGADAANTIIDGNTLDRVFHLPVDEADLTLNNLTVQGGEITDKGGGIYIQRGDSKLTASDVIITGNVADDGAGIFNGGILSLTDVVISNNGDATTNDGGGINNKGEATLNRVTISGNQADRDGGGINNQASKLLSLTDVTVSGNTAGNRGGGLYTNKPVTIQNSIISLNTANDGGGIYNEGDDPGLSLTNVTVSGNTASQDGGGLYTGTPATIQNSTFSSNYAADDGGGIINLSNGAGLSLTNVTISGNTAGDMGGGIASAADLTILNNTITLNDADNGGGIYIESNTASLKNTIVAENSALTGPDISGIISSQGHNLIQNPIGGLGFVGSDFLFINPELDPLADNGGPTETHALQSTSPAIDTPGITGSPATDQRGVNRDATPDIGAYECVPNNAPTITSTPVTDATEDSAYSYTFTVDDVDVGDTITLSAPTLPGWLSFNPATGELTGTPTNDDVGDHNVVLRVNDGTVDVDQSFTITVANTNDAPTITSTAVTSATEDSAYSYTFTVDDVDVGDTITLSAPTLPSWLSFNPVTGELTGTPTNDDVGDHNVVLRVNDGTVDVDQSFTITVANTNDPPTITSTAVTSATEDSAYSYTFTADDVDVGDTITLSAPTLPGWLSFNPATGELTGTPTNDDVGDHNVVLRVNNGTVDVDQSFTITVANTNDAPTITSTANTSATEDSPYSYTFTVDDVDIGDTITLSAPTLPGWLSFNPATGELTGAPTNDDVGDHNVVLRVNDGIVDVDQSFTITVANTNDPPTITSTAITSATEDSAYSYTFTVDDVDVGDTITLSAPTLPGWLTFNPATGELTGTPTNDDVGDHNVVLRVNDGTVDVDQSFTITVANTNDAPTITSTAVTSATEDSAYSYTFTVDDVDVGNTITLSAPTLPGWLSFNPATGELTGTPTNDDVGDHNVVLRVNDGTVDVDQSFTITVANTNDAPTITSTAVTSANEDSAYSYTFTVDDVDVGDTITLSAPTLPGWLSFNPATGELTGIPTNDDVGDHNVVLRVNDGTVDVDQSFTITVANTNDAPTITSTANTSATEDTPYSYTFTVDDVDVGDTITLSAPILPGWLSFNPATGELTGTPTNDDVGDHNVVLRVNDGTVDVDQSFTITVANTNDPPTITSTAVTNATEDSAYSYIFTVDDVDVGDTITLSAPILPGWLSFNPATGELTGTPTNDDVGDHNVVLRVNDGTVDVDQSFTITVANTNDAPTITGTAVTSATEDSAYSYTFTVDDVDVGDTITLSAPTLPGWLSFNPATGELTGTPTNDDVGDHNVVLRVNDGTVDVDQSFTITVANTNDAPTITSTAVTSATEDSAYSYTFTVDDVDVGDTITLSAPTLPGWLSFNPATGELTGTPTNDDVGDHNVVLRVNDGTVDVDQSFTITVANTNDAPVAVDDTGSVCEDNPLIIIAASDLLGNDTDLDGDPLTVSGFSQPDNGTLVDNGDGTFTYTPRSNFYGTDSFTYTISDNNGETSTATMMVEVNPVGDTPQVTDAHAVAGQFSELIFIRPNANDGSEVTGFIIADITNGILYLADGVTVVNNGDFITVAQGQAGLRFMPNAGSSVDGSFQAGASENGVTVAAQSGMAISMITVYAPDSLPDPTTEQSNPDPDPDQPENESPAPEIEESETESVPDEAVDNVEESSDSPPSRTERRNPGEENTIRNDMDIVLDNTFVDAGVVPVNLTDLTGIGEESVSRLAVLTEKVREIKTMIEQFPSYETGQNPTEPGPFAEESYKKVRKALEALDKEIGGEIGLSRTILGSAMATSVGLSAGYVLWLLKGGSLLASALASVPAWQVADPLAVLAGRKTDDDKDEDEETLEKIIEDAPDQPDSRKDKQTESETKTVDEKEGSIRPAP